MVSFYFWGRYVKFPRVNPSYNSLHSFHNSTKFPSVIVHLMREKLIMIVAYYFLLQIAGQLLNNQALEFYNWDGDLKELLQNVRDKLNKVAEVCFSKPRFYFHITNYL
jgi:hypothetical protein